MQPFLTEFQPSCLFIFILRRNLYILFPLLAIYVYILVLAKDFKFHIHKVKENIEITL